MPTIADVGITYPLIDTYLTDRSSYNLAVLYNYKLHLLLISLL